MLEGSFMIIAWRSLLLCLNVSSMLPNISLNGSSSSVPSSFPSKSENVPSIISKSNRQLTEMSGGHIMVGAILSCIVTVTMQLLTLPAASLPTTSTIIGPAPTSQQAKGTQSRKTVPLSRLFIGGVPPGISSSQAPSVVQSTLIQLSNRLTLKVTGEQLSMDKSLKTSAGTSVIPSGRSLVRLMTRCC